MSTSTYVTFNYDCDIYQPENYVPGDDDFSTEAIFSIDFFTENPCMYKKLDVLQKHILRESISWSTISSKLSELNVPYHAHPGMIQKIINYARSATNEDHNIDCQNIPFVVIIKATINTTYEESCSNRCVICLEDMLEGSEVARMPCLHIYHANCIVNWLKHSNVCPLCRFQITYSIANWSLVRHNIGRNSG